MTAPLAVIASASAARWCCLCYPGMEYRASYFRDRAASTRRLAFQVVTSKEDIAMLLQLARDFDELADDLHTGAVEIRHRELIPRS